MSRTTRALGITAIGGALLGLFLWGLPTREVLDSVGAAAPGLLAATVALNILILGVRALRWRLLFPSRQPVAIRSLFLSYLLGTMLNNLLPLKAGELARAAAAARAGGIPLPTVGATIVAERTLDVLMVLGLLVFLVVSEAITPTLGAGRLMDLVGGSAARFIGVAAVALLLLGILLAFLLRRARAGATDWASETIDLFRRDLRRVGATRRWILAAWLSVGIWLLYVTAIFLVLVAFRVPEATLLGAAFVEVAVSLGETLPSPGGIGTYHMAGHLSLEVLFPDAPVAQTAGAILVIHLLFWIPTTLLGLPTIWWASRGNPEGRR